ncbi:MAG: hypothetical protein E7463_02285 [Ruminococcaceae bacterium]|nr:hypothetical protein [Oscillospiraceae bacterium]
MKIGRLNAPDSGLAYTLTTWRVGGKIVCAPDEVQDGIMKWNWKTTMQTGVELQFCFEKPVFAASVALSLGADTRLTKAEVLTRDGDDRVVGVYRAESISDQERRIPGSFGGDIEITAAVTARCWVVRLFPTLTGELALPEPAFYGADFEKPVLYPTPAGITLGDGKLPLEALCAASCADDHADSTAALSYLRERLLEQWQLPSHDGSCVQIAHDEDVPFDGYRLEVGREGVKLAASTRLGLLYGVERLLELVDNGGVPFCTIDDKPYKKMRGFHIGLPPREEIPLFKKLLKVLLIPYHYNQIIIEFAGGMRFDRHPEISEAWLEGNRRSQAGEIPDFPHGSFNAGGKLLEKDEVRDFCDYARDLGFELIPEVQSCGHVQYITYAHPDIAETDESVTERKLDTRDADQPPSTYYHHSYCPSNPKSYEIIYDIIDEIVEVVRPQRFVHMGHDEIYQVGLCPRCKDIPHDQLYEKHVCAMHDYLAKKGLRMMIWADMLQPTEKKYKTSPAIARLPRDIVLLDFIWYFHFDLDMEDHLLPYGYEVMMGNLYSSHYPRFERRMAKDNMIGGQVSTWVRFEEYSLGKKGKLYDLMYTSEMLWSDTYDHRVREVYADILKKRIPVCRDRLHNLLHITRRYQPLLLPETPARVPLALREACEEVPSMMLTPRRLVGDLNVSVGGRADALRFVHTTLYSHASVAESLRPATTNQLEIGTYTVCYDDGTEEVISVEYDSIVRCGDKRWGMARPEPFYRHQGYVCTWMVDPILETKTEAGDDLTLLSYEWINPHPDKLIRSIVCRENDSTAAGLVLCGVSRVNFVK